MRHSPQKKLHIHLLIGLFPCSVNFLTILPIRFAAEEGLDPVIDHVLQVHEEVEVFLLHFVLIFHGESLTHEQFVPVLIEGHHEEGQKGYHQPKQTSYVGKGVIILAILPLYFLVLIAEANVPSIDFSSSILLDEEVIGKLICFVVPSLRLLDDERGHAGVCFNFVGAHPHGDFCSDLMGEGKAHIAIKVVDDVIFVLRVEGRVEEKHVCSHEPNRCQILI